MSIDFNEFCSAIALVFSISFQHAFSWLAKLFVYHKIREPQLYVDIDL